MLFVDPPSGWKYGFPKIFNGKGIPDNKWFINNGYPQDLINKGMLQYCRMCEEEVNVYDEYL